MAHTKSKYKAIHDAFTQAKSKVELILEASESDDEL
jgi:hypothetical protein